MDSQPSEMDVDMYDVIFKTIYLFLETNEFHETADSFLSEIKVKFDRSFDKSTSNAKTLVLRPCFETTDDIQEFGFSLNDKQCKHFDSGQSYVGINNQNTEGNLEKLTSSGSIHELQSAVETYPYKSKQLIPKSNQQLYEIYSYPDTHCSVDLPVILKDSLQIHNKLHDDTFKNNAVCQSESSHNYKSITSKKINTCGLINQQEENKVDENYLSKNMRELPTMSNSKRFTSSMSISNDELSNEDSDRRSPSRFGSEFNLKPPPSDFEKNKHLRVNKSATLPALNISPSINNRSKSRSAPYLTEKQIKQTKSSFAINNKPTQRLITDKPVTSRKTTPRISPILSPEVPARLLPSQGRWNTRNQDVKINELTDKRVKSRSSSLSPRVKQVKENEEHNKVMKEKTTFIPDKQKSKLVTKKLISRVQMPKKVSVKTSKLSKNVRDTDRERSKSISKDYQRPNLNNIKQSGTKYLNLSSFEEELSKSVDIKNDFIEGHYLEDSVGSGTDSSRSESDVTKELDWCALKKALYEGPPDVKMKLLQALRWRLTDTNGSKRESNLLQFVKNDVVSIDTIPPHGQLFMESFYCPKKTTTPHPLQEEMARFINTLASLAMGRLYLERDESLLSVMLLPLLMGKLPGIKIYDLTRAFTMATVQKLSLSNRMREVIISAGTIEWLVTFIEKNHHKLTTYEAEYSTALLTNLSINKEARRRCERIADRVVTVIEDLIETPHKCCLTYINPILYSLLLNPVINERANSRGINMRLKQLYNVYGDNEDLKLELDSIIAMHVSRDFCSCEDQEIEELNSQNCADYLEQELLLRDPIYHTPIGEEFLKTFYTTEPTKGYCISHFRKEEVHHPSIVQIVKRNCVCNNKSVLRLEERLLVEEESVARVLPVVSIKPNKWQTRPTEGTKNNYNLNKNNQNVINNSNRRNLKPVNATKIKNKENNRGERQRSISQPPFTKKTIITPRIEPKQQRNNEAEQFKKLDQENEEMMKRLEEIRMVPSSTTMNVHTGMKLEFVVNCCYKMDYVNAMAAPPGEYVPQTMHTSSPNLNLCDSPESQDDHKACACYNEMKHYIGNYFDSPKSQNGGVLSSNSKITKKSNGNQHLSVVKTPSLFRRKSSDSSPCLNQHPEKNLTCLNCKQRLPLRQMKDIADEVQQFDNQDDNQVITRNDGNKNRGKRRN